MDRLLVDTFRFFHPLKIHLLNESDLSIKHLAYTILFQFNLKVAGIREYS